MPRKFFKRFLPSPATIRKYKHLQIFGKLTADPNLFHLNRYSVATAFSVGLFSAFVPVPFQMVIAAALAILLRANLPLSVIVVWVSNPITMGPMFFFAFKLGAWILGREPTGFHIELSFSWLTSSFLSIWAPLLLGCFICGSILAIFSNIFMRLLWRYIVSKNWKERKKRYKAKLLAIKKQAQSLAKKEK